MSKHIKHAGMVGAALLTITVCLALWVGLSPHTRVPIGNQTTSQPDSAYKVGGAQCDARALAAIVATEERQAKAEECAEAQDQYRREQAELNQQTRAANAGAIVAWFTYDQTRIALAQAILSFLALIATAWAAWGAVVAARAAQSSVEVTRVSSERQLRAYLTVEAGQGDFDIDDGKMVIDLSLQNTGQTPAYNVRYRSDAALLTMKQADSYDFEVADQTVLSQITIGGSQISYMPIHLLEQANSTAIAEAVAAKIGDSTRRLFVFGQVYYDDAFGRDHVTKFCRFVIWSTNPNSEKTHWVYGFRRHNEST